ncbi:MAG: lysS [Candidatus Taylorbacteria bacterium]|nr:lysS [Candidatus Taylorbacteria bacterium]
MASLEELRATRIEKLELLKKAGMNPFPAKVPRTTCLADAKANFAEGKAYSVVGRVMAIRGQGAIIFIVLDDGKAKFQAVFKKDAFEAAGTADFFELFTKAIDIGDFISVTGTFFTTQRGEQSILVTSWVIAAKALLPLPEKWHGITDSDERYRKRYLDFVMNPELRDVFYKKAKFWEVTRRVMNQHGFLEVETPTLEVTTGGAEAAPFKTHHNDFDLPVYMRISIGELWQKRLMAGGFQKTFEIGRAYRNEGSSPDHLQEFTNMEFYWAYADYKDGMELTQELYRTIATEVFGTTKFTSRGHTFDLADEWKLINYVDEIKAQTGIDVIAASEDDMKKKLQELKVKYDGENKERLTDTLWKYCRKNISGPAFLVDHPLIVGPLAKPVIDEKGVAQPKVQMFQPLFAGSEVGRGYSELNDPIDQKARFDAQAKLLAAGDTEAMMPDYEFVEMLEHGMPPTCGFGFGERVFAILMDKPIREMQTFPLMRPKEEGK